jgi:hypothetical protein
MRFRESLWGKEVSKLVYKEPEVVKRKREYISYRRNRLLKGLAV